MKYALSILCLTVLLAASALPVSDGPKRIPVDQLGTAYQLVGKLNTPFGETITVVGVVADHPNKAGEGPYLQVRQIAGHPVDKEVEVLLKPYLGEWGKEQSSSGTARLPKLEMGKTYEMEGYETGGYRGSPGDAEKIIGIAAQDYVFGVYEEFVVYRARRVEPLTPTPSSHAG